MIDKIVSDIGRVSYRLRWLIAILGVLLFACVFYLQTKAIIEYSYAEESLVNDIFPQDDTVLLVYDNIDEAKINEIIAYLEKDERVTSIQGYANTLGALMSPSDVTELMGIDVSAVNMLFYIKHNGTDAGEMTLVEFVSFISSDTFMNNDMFASMIDDDTKAQISQLSSIISALASDKEYTAKEIADMLGVEEQLVNVVFYVAGMKDTSATSAPATIIATLAQIFGMSSEEIEASLGIKPVTALKFADFVDVISEVSSYASGLIDEEQLAQLNMLKGMSDIVRAGKSMTPAELAEVFSGYAENDSFNESNLSLLYLLAKSNAEGVSLESIALYDLFTFLSEDILGNESFAGFFDESAAAQFEEAKVTMEDGKAQLVGELHSRMVFTLSYVLDSPEIKAFYNNLTAMLDETMTHDYYLVGASAMAHHHSHGCFL